jgi:5-formyltetrahydrofolate cyclo-ligase
MGESRSVAAEKARLRAEFRQRRGALGLERRAAGSRRICHRAEAWIREQGARTVSAFWPLAEEPDLRPLVRALHGAAIRVVLPVVLSARNEAPRLGHRAFSGEAALAPGRFGVMEPLAGDLVAPEAIDVALVPALAVDPAGVRLGYGGGFYDAYLAETNAVRIGVVFASGVAEALPAELHDARLDGACTPDGLVWFGTPGR